ncbi:MAG: glycosyltransferase [Paludibacter sp.]|nr:glycosyltransferase [Bacteroidales bacterium]MCM1068328.1 glycosyltransferase [Prevotella sp.]MCM1354044.1 glycosyltransferase [Bacteroides sp.]MCM1442114.1 glycosyltransferase [Muribaculum sp.]MCM1481993.1 glycosyltransferase [Paludibacter sp.]
MMSLLTDITLTDYVVGGILLVAFLLQIVFYVRYMAGVNRRLRSVRKGDVARPIARPAVSVVVCARNESDNLAAYLPVLLSQQYPEYEVIVVDDESEDDTRVLLERYMHLYPNLRITFVPKNARGCSGKKLALTLAAKAARYDYLLLTDADCRPESPHWIEEMMCCFTEGTEIVLGYGAYFTDNHRVNRLIQYDTLFNGLQYMGMALAHKPYMGVGRNLAYRKDMFFREKGFAGLLGNRAGDDDLFVNKVANARNTNVAVTPDSLTWSIPKTSFSEWMHQKKRHLSVSPAYKMNTKFRLTVEPFVRGVFYGALLAAALLGSPLLWIVASALFVVRLVVQLTILNVAACRWRIRPFGVEIILFDVFLPLNNLFLLAWTKVSGNNKQQW